MKRINLLSLITTKRILLVLLVLFIVGCNSRDVRLRTAAVMDRKATPVIYATDVNTIISDSGIVRYRIVAKTWQVFDKADTPNWNFPDGIYLERFDENLKPDATVEADYAFYNEAEQQWLLQGNVKALNTVGETFETPLLYWNQKTESVYSDSSIVITREKSIIEGVGFRSNQSMTKYTILRPTGVFPIEE